MQKKSLETILYSTVGILVMLVLIVVFNFVASAARTRIDLTEEKAYTLSAGTRAILKKLDTPVKIRFYCTKAENATPHTVLLGAYAKRVEDLLMEYKQAAHGKLVIEKFDPQPDSDAEDSAHLDGIEGEQLPDGERFYLGIAVTMLGDQRQTLPFLDPGRERLLEYDLSRAISRVVAPEKPVVGIMSPLPVFGMPSNPMMARMGQQGQEPWALVTELKNDFSVERVGMDVEKIDDTIKVLVVIHPREISEKAQYAIDQFIMRGGKLIAFLDALPLVDAREQNQMFGSIPNSGSNLEKLLKAWGVNFDTTKVVADLNFKMQLGGRNNQVQEAPAFLSLTARGINTNDVVTSQIDNIWMPFAGSFSGTPVEGLKETVLLTSTPDSQLVDGFMANLSGETVLKDFKRSGTAYPLAIRLTGKFKTAFPNGKPEEKKDDTKKDEEKKDDAGKPEEKTAEKKPDDSLKETTQENTVILVGDADMIFDHFTLRQMQTPFGTLSMAMNGNLNFAQNAIEQLTGDNNLITVRSRATQNRPFEKVKQMEAAANEKFRSEIKRLEDSAAQAQQKVNELQQQKKGDQRFVLSPEQQKELLNLRKEEAETRKTLKKVQKDFRKEVVSLQTRLKWINVLAVPLAVTVSGIAMAAVKRKKTSAK